MLKVIFVPGLSDRVGNLKIITKWWSRKGVLPYVTNFGWKDDDYDFDYKLESLIKLAKKLSQKNKVSIVGTSAGGSAAFNAFLDKPEIIDKAVSVCGRLRPGDLRLFDKSTSSSPTFKTSVLKLYSREIKIPKDITRRMMTISPIFGDEIVPSDTSYLNDAYNIKVPTGEHIFSIAMSLTLFAKPILEFLHSD